MQSFKITLLISCIGLFLTVQTHATDKNQVTLYYGLKPYTVEALPYTKPPVVRLDQFLAGLEIEPTQRPNGVIEARINKRLLVFDPARKTATFNNKTLPFPNRNREGKLYTSVDTLTAIFSDLLGREMVYDPSSRSLHVPRSTDIVVTVRTRKVGDDYRLILIYSQPIARPTLKVSGRNMVLKIKEPNLVFDKSGFEANEAINSMAVFDNLPDESIEVLFKMGPDTKTWSREPFNPENPRTIIKLSGRFGDELDPLSGTVENDTGGLKRIVIDPGHGGKDQGAMGPTGLMEKSVTLDLAKQLKKMLSGDYEVYLTREDDTFISLKTRTGFANNKKADLFVSIHVNAINLPNATGSETYYLSLDASTHAENPHYQEFEDTEAVAVDPTEALDDELSIMLWDMAQTKHLEDSFRVARYVQESLNILSGIRNRGVKQASLKVLKGATMPAVLVEVAFISNKHEEKKLKARDFREKIVRAVANAIRQYDEDVKRRAKPGSGTDEGDL